MMSFFDALYVLLPELIILLTACKALLASLFFKQRFKNASYFITLSGLLLSVLVSFFLLDHERTLLFDGLFVSDYFSQLMKGFMALIIFIGFFYARDYLIEHDMAVDEFFILSLFSLLGMMALVSAHSMLTLYLGLEVLSLPLYAMVAMMTKKEVCSEAAMKYFVMGAIASGFLLYGFSLLYGVTGKLDLMEVSNGIAIQWETQSVLIMFALVFVLCGTLFKLAAAPFHMWAPDVYQGAPHAVTMFISAAPKIAALGMLIRLLTIAFPDLVAQWQQILILIALLSAGVGNILAVCQTEVRRLFAYSAIAHAGYALFGIIPATEVGYAAALFYIFIYALMSVAIFGLFVLLSRQGVFIQTLEDFKGMNARHPWLAFLMMICLFSMAGVPPMVGFFTKLMVLKALIDVGMIWIAVLGLLFAVIGAYYYIKVIKLMYFDAPIVHEMITLPTVPMVFLSMNSLLLLFLGLFPSTFMLVCMNAVSGF